MMSRLSFGVSTSSEKTGICCGTGEHGLVDVLGGDAAERRGVRAAGQRATGAGEVVARGAVGAEELDRPGRCRRFGLGDVVLLGRGWPGRGRGRRRRPPGPRSPRRCRQAACAAPGRPAAPSASGRCRPGSRPRRRRRRPAGGRSWLPRLVWMPSAFLPWQDAQPTRKSCAALATWSASFAWRSRRWPGDRAAYSPPVTRSPAAAPAAPPAAAPAWPRGGRPDPVASFEVSRTSESFWSVRGSVLRCPALLDQVDRSRTGRSRPRRRSASSRTRRWR